MKVKTIKNCIGNYPFIPLIILLIAMSMLLKKYMIEGFGEPDSARIGVSVINMVKNGNSSPLSTYYFSDNIPLYVILLKSIVKFIGNNFQLLPQIMNQLGIFFSIINLFIAYVFTRKITKNEIVALTVVIFYFLIPGFFISAIYGFPHIISNTFFIASLYFFTKSISDQSNTVCNIVMVTVFMFLSISLKSDIVLFLGAYLGLLFYYDKLNKKNLLILLIQLAISFLLFYFMRNLFLPNLQGSTTSTHNFKEWLSRFTSFNLTLSSFFQYQIKPILYTFGVLTNILLLTVLFLIFIQKKWKMLKLFLSWTFVPTIFWMLIFGNSARHNFANILPVVILITSYFYNSLKNKGFIAIVFIILFNMIITPPNSSTGLPSAKIFQSSVLINQKRNNNHRIGEYITSTISDNVYIFGSYHNPWIIYEIIKDCDSYNVEALPGLENYSLEVINNNHKKNFKIFYLYKTIKDLPSEIIKLQKTYNLTNEGLYISLIGNIEILTRNVILVKSISTTSDNRIIIK